MDSEIVRRLEELLLENTCSGIEICNGGLQVIFGDRSLVVQSAWRLIQNSEIVAASDDREQLQTVTVILSESSVETVFVESNFNDLTIHFKGGVVLQTFADAEQYEHWYCASGPHEVIVAGPGKLWSYFPQVPL